MKKLVSLVLFAAAVVGSSAAVAQTLPDGPVAGPPGWSCVASGGVVHCTKKGAQ